MLLQSDEKRDVVFNNDGSIHAFLDCDDARIREDMERSNLYKSFMANHRRKIQEDPEPVQLSSILPMVCGRSIDIYCYFSGFENSSENGLMHYYFCDRFASSVIIKSILEDSRGVSLGKTILLCDDAVMN
jgi:hypothetical protein